MMIMGKKPDSKCVFTYVQSLVNHLRRTHDLESEVLICHSPEGQTEHTHTWHTINRWCLSLGRTLCGCDRSSTSPFGGAATQARSPDAVR
ncbi:hypothetical protein AGOR_G00055200 [Albula goreensis]|uniref:Uncharacterized protein n=1 Tax=Albula goreensis TaxID=1534307 RepID=A0A8T3DU54_9TELE|nr:hypothetical protein AGOR_G00055200 [Albula goreensis]